MTQVEKTKNPCPSKIAKTNSKDFLAKQLETTGTSGSTYRNLSISSIFKEPRYFIPGYFLVFPLDLIT